MRQLQNQLLMAKHSLSQDSLQCPNLSFQLTLQLTLTYTGKSLARNHAIGGRLGLRKTCSRPRPRPRGDHPQHRRISRAGQTQPHRLRAQNHEQSPGRIGGTEVTTAANRPDYQLIFVGSQGTNALVSSRFNQRQRHSALGPEECKTMNEIPMQHPPREPIALNKKEAARLLGVSLRTIDRLIALKELQVRRLGRRVLIPRSALDGFLRRDHPTQEIHNVAARL